MLKSIALIMTCLILASSCAFSTEGVELKNPGMKIDTLEDKYREIQKETVLQETDKERIEKAS